LKNYIILKQQKKQVTATLGLISPVSGALIHNMITIAAVSNAATPRKQTAKPK
jgi:cation transport ATPase